MFQRQTPSTLARQIVDRANASPEFWLFNPAATPKDIKRLEARLGRTLPEPLAELLMAFNGGFAAQGKVAIDSHPEIHAAKAGANRFLACHEIESAYRRLLGAHPEEDPLLFPYVPFMRLAEGSYLVINAEDPRGAAWDAWTMEGPHVWKRLYPSLNALLWDYLGRQGQLLEEPGSDEPCAQEAAY